NKASQNRVTTPQPESSKEEDDFQVQATPPRARPTRKRGSPALVVDDDETSSGEDTAEPAPASISPENSKVVVSKLGTIGKNNKPTLSPPPPKTASHKSTEPQNVASDTQSETASEPDDADAVATPPLSHPKTLPRRGGLGRIGG